MTFKYDHFSLIFKICCFFNLCFLFKVKNKWTHLSDKTTKIVNPWSWSGNIKYITSCNNLLKELKTKYQNHIFFNGVQHSLTSLQNENLLQRNVLLHCHNIYSRVEIYFHLPFYTLQPPVPFKELDLIFLRILVIICP